MDNDLCVVNDVVHNSPWRNAYWFARILLNTDQYGAIGKKALEDQYCPLDTSENEKRKLKHWKHRLLTFYHGKRKKLHRNRSNRYEIR